MREWVVYDVVDKNTQLEFAEVECAKTWGQSRAEGAVSN